MGWWDDVTGGATQYVKNSFTSPFGGFGGSIMNIGSGRGSLGDIFGTNSGAAAEGGRNNLSGEMYQNALNSGGPAYQQAYDPVTMAQAPGVQNRLNKLNVNTQGLDKFRNQATQAGPSAWANMSQAKQLNEEGALRDRAKREALSSQQGLQSQLAMGTGGLSSGAKERGALATQKNLLGMSQDVGQQGIQNRMQIGINDQQNKMSQLQALPGMENQLFTANMSKEDALNNANRFDMQQQVAETGRRNQ